MSYAIIITLLVAAVIGAAVLNHALEKKRLARFAAWAQANGWSFEPDRVRDPELPFELCERGHSRSSRYHASREIAGATPGLDSASVMLCEYHYAVTTGAGKHRRTHHYYFTCAIVEPGVDVGRIEMRPEGLGDKLVQAFGFDDIDFEDVEFSKRFVVSASDRKHAYDLLDGPMMRFFVAHGEVIVQTNHRRWLVCNRGSASPESYASIEAYVRGMLAQLPRPLVNEARARAGLAPLIEAGNAAPSSLKRRAT